MSETNARTDVCSAEATTAGTDSCAIRHDRRDFLRAGLMAVGALATLGVTPDRLSALERRFAVGRRTGDELRYPIPAADGVTIDTPNKVILARVGGVALAFVLECPHRGESVTWQGDRNRFYCPKHRSTFQPNGTLIGGRAERGLDRYALRRDGDELVVDLATKLRSDNAATDWAAAQVTL
ncbi:MAG: Rieske (2Fe-2S) protein [Gemmatimonadaceae bacterium]|nr:Rieske (2Fe-2S) protein [Gemmatimonadaceae bacterium]MCW5826516.1 Rieske (2Fe-2S) protein [Gemmatimonadaceae bacterium]